jgi:hypothetical protein
MTDTAQASMAAQGNALALDASYIYLDKIIVKKL